MQKRQERVAALTEQMKSGSYIPNLANLSNSILDEDLDTALSYAD